ncbi:hypothetical protein JTB14_017317 [Gonioctena quinquepunctata]|nr:hypothetical protein JTB14_017317 [Gonioctena quinquepunctata]
MQIIIRKRYRFPKSDENLCKFWIEQVNNPVFVEKSLEQIYKTYVVCDTHFPNEFKLNSKRGLIPKAYPTLFLPESSKSIIEENVIPSKRTKKVSVEDVQAEIFSEEPCSTSLH